MWEGVREVSSVFILAHETLDLVEFGFTVEFKSVSLNQPGRFRNSKILVNTKFNNNNFPNNKCE